MGVEEGGCVVGDWWGCGLGRSCLAHTGITLRQSF